MREIKFRVWDTQEEKYLYPEKQGFIIVPTRPSFGVTLPYENTHNPNNIDEDCFDWADADLLMGRYRLEQYTGLLDSNGIEICEGDIVRDGDDPDEIGSILFADGGFQIDWCINSERLDGDISDYIEVIGNIHENPELIGGKK